MDPISTVSGSLAIGQGIFQFLGYIKNLVTSDVISAYFNSNGERTAGSDKIEIEKHPHSKDQAIWFYSVKVVTDYVFVRIPVTSSGIHELLGRVSEGQNPDARYWRWIALPQPGVIRSGDYEPPNAKVDFIVVGYKPKALISHFST